MLLVLYACGVLLGVLNSTINLIDIVRNVGHVNCTLYKYLDDGMDDDIYLIRYIN